MAVDRGICSSTFLLQHLPLEQGITWCCIHILENHQGITVATMDSRSGRSFLVVLLCRSQRRLSRACCFCSPLVQALSGSSARIARCNQNSFVLCFSGRSQDRPDFLFLESAWVDRYLPHAHGSWLNRLAV